MKKILKLSIIFLIAIIFIVAIFSGYFLNEFFIKRPASDAQIVFFEIEKGDSVKKISAELKKLEIINSRFNFETYVWLVGLQGVFQPGEYAFKSGRNIYSLVKEMTAINIKEASFTIIEGWTLRDIAEYLKNKGLIKKEKDLYYLTGRPAVDYREEKVDFKGGWNYDFLTDKPEYLSLEGYIYPDTYKILADAGAENLLKKALVNFNKKLTPVLRERAEARGLSIFELITRASVVEKEVDTYEDRRIVADIVDRRLKRGMALQMDSSINYITDSGRSRSTFKDLEVDSPWNTYKYTGLPLGPICNPSILSIQAVLYPTPNQYLYFLTDKEGKVYYAKTYNEHLGNRKYLD